MGNEIRYVGYELAEPSTTRPFISLNNVEFDGEFFTVDLDDNTVALIGQTFRRDGYTVTIREGDAAISDSQLYTVPTIGMAWDLVANWQRVNRCREMKGDTK